MFIQKQLQFTSSVKLVFDLFHVTVTVSIRNIPKLFSKNHQKSEESQKSEENRGSTVTISESLTNYSLRMYLLGSI